MAFTENDGFDEEGNPRVTVLGVPDGMCLCGRYHSGECD